MDHKDLCEHTRIRLIAAAIGHQQCTKTAANVIPIPGGDQVIAIGMPADVVRMLAAETTPTGTEAGFDLTVIEERARHFKTLRMFTQEDFALVRLLADDVFALIALARQAAPATSGSAAQPVQAGEAVDEYNKHFTPMEAHGTLVYLGRSGGFDVRDCPDAEHLAQFIVHACNRASLAPVSAQQAGDEQQVAKAKPLAKAKEKPPKTTPHPVEKFAANRWRNP